jgi:cyclopropane fatty-acyl-phospholipid synthase-like methyltransferase
MTRFIRRFLPETVGLKVLDIGSGAGASSIVLARLGMNVTGIERDRELHEIATRRVQEWGLSSQIHQECVTNASNGLPFQPESFDAIVLSAVVEHVDPSDRLKLLGQAWSVLKTGGLLFIHDTPNRLWPYDGHTTGLWFTTWLPWRLRMAYARRFSRRFPSTISEQELISKGLHPPTYWEIKLALSSSVCLNQKRGNDVSFAFGLTDHKKRSLPLALTRGGVIWFLRQAGRAVAIFQAPPAAILQNLDVCFQKL